MKTKRFGETLPIRVNKEMEMRIRAIAKAAEITTSDAVRIAVNLGLPQLESGRINVALRGDLAGCTS